MNDVDDLGRELRRTIGGLPILCSNTGERISHRSLQGQQ